MGIQEVPIARQRLRFCAQGGSSALLELAERDATLLGGVLPV